MSNVRLHNSYVTGPKPDKVNTTVIQTIAAGDESMSSGVWEKNMNILIKNHGFQPTVTTFKLVKFSREVPWSHSGPLLLARFFVISGQKSWENFLLGGGLCNIMKGIWRGYMKMLWRVNVTFNFHLQKLKSVYRCHVSEDPRQSAGNLEIWLHSDQKRNLTSNSLCFRLNLQWFWSRR